MTKEYYAAHYTVTDAINKLLKLPATGQEQDWEIELADPTKIDEILNLLATGSFDIDFRTALVMLLISSMEDAYQSGVMTNEQFHRTKDSVFANDEIRQRMEFYWLKLNRALDSEMIAKIFAN